MKRLLTLLMLASAAPTSAPSAGASGALILGYVSRPGLAEVIDGKPVGTYLETAVAAVEKAGLPYTLQAVTQPRLMAQIASGQPNYCAVGIFRTPERERSARFSQPIYRTPRFVVIGSHSKEAAFRQHKSFVAVVGDPGLKMGMIEGYSHGNTLDPVIAKMHGNIERYVGTFDQGFAKLAAGRFDYLITFPQEFDSWLTRSGTSPALFLRLDFPDLLDGVPRHVMCSRAVAEATMQRLDAGIAALHLKLNSNLNP